MNDVSQTSKKLVPIEPQPEYIESSGRWRWPLPERARSPGGCTELVTASGEWWEDVPFWAKPHPYAEAIQLRDGAWMWIEPAPESPAPAKRTEILSLLRQRAYLHDQFRLAEGRGGSYWEQMGEYDNAHEAVVGWINDHENASQLLAMLEQPALEPA